MLKHFHVIFLLAMASLIHVSQGTLISKQLYPSCTGTALATTLPNFSYAKALQISGATYACTGLSTTPLTPLSPPLVLNVTWNYYATYVPGQTPSCGNPALPDGDQCCHSRATSTLSFYYFQYVTTYAAVEAISTGNVTAGPFLGQTVTWTLLDPNAVALNLQCLSTVGQEAWGGSTTLTFGNGVICANGVQWAESCPGWH